MVFVVIVALSRLSARAPEGAVDQLLLAERFKMPTENLVQRLHSSQSGPEGSSATKSLVFDRTDCSPLHPVDNDCLNIVLLVLDCSSGWHLAQAQESLGELFLRVGGELIDAHLVGFPLFGIVLLNGCQIAVEDSPPVKLLSLGPKLNPERSLPLLKLSEALPVELLHGEEGGGDNCCHN